MSNVYLKNKTSSAITVAGYSVYYIDKADAEIVEVEGANQQPLPNVGDTITFGNYPQATNDPEPIEWMVLEVDSVNGRAFLLSKRVLDCQQYNTSSASVTWKTCSLRTWLNSTFLNAAFDSAEQDMIILSHVETPNNGSSSGGDPTDDKLFNLSIQDAVNSAYFATASARRALGTQYAINAGATSSSGYLAWWTRSPGDTSLSTATRVANNSSATFYNTNVNATTVGVRPAMWLSFVSIIKYNAFKYFFSGVPYWYVIDGVQANWTDDLSSIGYSEVVPLPTVTFRNGSIGTISAQGKQTVPNGSSVYHYIYSDGAYHLTEVDAGVVLAVGRVTDSGAQNRIYYGFTAERTQEGYILITNNTGATFTDMYGVLVYVCSSNLATVVPVYNFSNVAYNAFKFTASGTEYYYVLDGTQADWVSDLSSIGYSLSPIST